MAVQSKVREVLAQRFTEALEMGQLPWQACWAQERQHNAVTGVNYHGINAAWLSYYADDKGWHDPRWCTFNQAREQGWSVRKGEKATYVEYWAYFDTKQDKLLSWDAVHKLLRDDPDYERNLQLRCRTYAVFNGAQIDGIPEYTKSQQTDIGEIRAQRDTLIANMGVGYKERGIEAYYTPTEDTVVLPPEATFDDTYSYMATLLHECGHATGHESRLDRPLDGYGADPESYANEELRAEIASAFTAQALGLQLTPAQQEAEIKRHMAYVQSWANHIKDAPEALFKAIKDAEKISDYLIEKGEFQPIIDRAQEVIEIPYYHFYCDCKYLFSVQGKDAANEIVGQLTTAFHSCGLSWSDSGDVMHSYDRQAALSIRAGADPDVPKVYREATQELIEEHLQDTCYFIGRVKTLPAESLSAGWIWEHFEDGSGHLKSPEGQVYFGYDKQPYYPNGVEYQTTRSDMYKTFWGSFEEFQEHAEACIQTQLEREASLAQERVQVQEQVQSLEENMEQEM